MLKRSSPIWIIATKDVADAMQDRFIIVVTAFLVAAALTALVTGAVALATDVMTYNDARTTLLALGKSADAIAAPEFYPLRLLRGAVEQTEIIGAVIAILVGYRAAASERGRKTLALIMTRPIQNRQFMVGKALGGLMLLAGGLAIVFVLTAITLQVVSGVGLTLTDLGRIAIIWASSVVYAYSFFLLSFMLAFWLKKLPTALLLSFSIWLLVVLVAPQIGDTLDPDNQVAGGVFKQLHILKTDQIRIMRGYASFETIREGIEAASLTKRFERLSFAVLGIKDTYVGKPLASVLKEKQGDALWLVLVVFVLQALLFSRPIDLNRLTQE